MTIEPKTVLLTGGRAPAALELARILHRAGHRVLAAESVRRHLCRVSRAVENSFRIPAPNAEPRAFLAALESIVEEERVDALIPTCEEIFYVAQGLDRLRRHCKVLASPIAQLKELHNKWRFVLLARRLGLAVPPTEPIASREDWLSLASGERRHEHLVLKPAYSRFASRVIFLDGDAPPEQRRRLLLERAPAFPPAPHGSPALHGSPAAQGLQASRRAPPLWVAQRRVFGREICTYSVACEGQLIAHAAYPSTYRTGPGAAVYFQPIEHPAAREWVRAFVQAIRFTGQIAFDFIEDGNGALHALECNPRTTSGVHLLGADSRFAQALLQPEVLRDAGVVVTPEGAKPAMVGAAMLAAVPRGSGGLRHWARDVLAARDVVFDWSDPHPAVEALRMLHDAWRTSRKWGVSMTQAMTLDIEWNGGL